MYFTAGSRCTWTGTWGDVGFFSDPSGSIPQVTAYLEANCNMAIEASSVNQPITLITKTATTITLKIRTLIDRNDVNDVSADIQNAFNTQVNLPPDSAAIQDYTLAQNGSTANQTKQQTGAPDPNAGNTGDDTNPTGLALWWKNTVASVEAGSVGFIIGGAVVIGLLVFIAVRSEV